MTRNFSAPLLWASLVYYATIGLVLHFTRGSYDLTGLMILFAGWATISAIAIGTEANSTISPASKVLGDLLEPGFWVVIVFFGYKLLRNDMVHAIDSKHAQRVMKAFLWGSFLCSFIALVRSLITLWYARTSSEGRVDSGKFQKGLCLVIGGCLFAAKVFAIRTSLHPVTDVFTIYTTGADYLRAGLNPYAQAYVDIYHGAFKYVPVYCYWPATTVPESVSKWIFGDIRVAFILADAITAVVLGVLVRSLQWPKSMSYIVPLLWISFPVTLFVLDQSWVDTMLVLYATLFALFAVRDRWIIAGIAMGLFCATKQYSIFFAFLSLLLVLPRGRKALVQMTFSALVTFLAVMLPFVFWNWRAFYSSTIAGVLTQPAREDALSLVAAAKHLLNWSFPALWSAGIYLVVLGAASIHIVRGAKTCVPKYREWAAGLVLVYGATFLFGKQAFCNYYYLLAYFVLMLVLFSNPAGVQA